jgi:hypothetical protein
VIYLRTETSLAHAKEFWRGLDENLDIMPDALRRQLRQVDGLLAQVGERQVEASRSVAGSSKECSGGGYTESRAAVWDLVGETGEVGSIVKSLACVIVQAFLIPIAWGEGREKNFN